ncbi:PepSY-associated TM helix domain-containing protein [Kordiimonas lacus]|uniref:Uncharacterized iron-regulated membrane protein n=1 Tax=Kordiimonas lacus TaxID=637679 RepID=A0A1G7FDU5_9PROT|nr:PepSY-associated TM helix domain-containing protein [Kordiimonas lacus]SDE74056.1 Uncharacterized iron-regulated membrane protein [Kordiimonas lacus]
MRVKPTSAARTLGYIGLLTYAVLLGVLAVTGAMQAYYYELDEWLNPQFYNMPTRGGAQHPADLISALESQIPGARVWYMEQRKANGRSVMMAVEPAFNSATQTYANLPHTYYYMDPVTAEIVGGRTWGACCFEPENLMNFTYELHRTLMLPSVWGLYITGGVAIIWCLGLVAAGAWALMRRQTTHTKWMATTALMMTPLALSSVAMNLNDELFRPVVNWFSPVKPTIYGEYATKGATDLGTRAMSYRDAYDNAITLGKENGWATPPGELFYSGIYNFYGFGYGVRDPQGMGNDWAFISADDGRLLRARTPREGTAGEIFTAAQLPIHSGRILGGWSQFYVFAVGLLITYLCWRLGRYAILGLRKKKP